MAESQPKQELAVRQATQSAVAQLQDNEFAEQITLAVPEGVSSRQLLRAAATAVLDNPKLAAPALRASLLQATLKIAQDGLLPDGRDAAFVIYKTRQGEKIQYQPMIGGLRRIAADHGWMLQTVVVFENDSFDPDLDEGRANHKQTPLNQDRGNPIGAYATGRHRDGQRMIEVMNVAEIEKVRAVSRAKDAGPWVDWWERMAEKTVGKRLFKKLPLDPKDRRIASVLHALEDEPVDALYGPNGSEGGEGHDGSAGAPYAATDAPADPEPQDAEWEDAGNEGWEPDEPSDEELAALGAGAAIPPAEADEIRFPSGRFKGMTFADIHANGEVGIGYLRWALRGWSDGPLKDSLREYAATHPELSAGE